MSEEEGTFRLELGLNDSLEFKKLIKALSKIVDEVGVICSESGLEFRAMNASNTAMIIAKLPAESFDTFEITGDFKFELFFDQFANAVKNFGAKEMHVTIDQQKIKLEGRSGSKRKTMELPQLVTSIADARKKPTLEFDFSAFIDSSELAEIISDFRNFGAYKIQVAYENDRFSVKHEDYNGNFCVELEDVDIETPGEFSSFYNVEFLKQITSLLKLGKTVKFSAKSQFPLCLEIESPTCSVEYILAPMIDNA